MMNGDMDKNRNNGFRKDLPLHRFFIFELKDIYGAETDLISNMPIVYASATSEELRSVISRQLKQREGQVKRLKNIFDLLEEKRVLHTCKAIAGILEEVADMINETAYGSTVRDAAIIVAAQKIEHYEIAAYGSLLAFSELMGHQAVSARLQKTLTEKMQANDALTALAKDGINELAGDELPETWNRTEDRYYH